jgi:hypothetical protein
MVGKEIDDGVFSDELEAIEEFEERKFPLWVKILIWFVVFILTFWSVAWFY